MTSNPLIFSKTFLEAKKRIESVVDKIIRAEAEIDQKRFETFNQRDREESS